MTHEEMADTLRKAGYTVTAPRCPECKGNGFIMVIGEQTVSAEQHSWSVGTQPCPRGCPKPILRYSHGPITREPIVDARARETRTHDL